MAQRLTQYTRELEKGLKKGSLAKAHAGAAKRSKTSVKFSKPKRKRLSQRELIAKTARRLKELFYGGKTYAGKKVVPSRKPRYGKEPIKRPLKSRQKEIKRLKTKGK